MAFNWLKQKKGAIFRSGSDSKHADDNVSPRDDSLSPPTSPRLHVPDADAAMAKHKNHVELDEHWSAFQRAVAQSVQQRGRGDALNEAQAHLHSWLYCYLPDIDRWNHHFELDARATTITMAPTSLDDKFDTHGGYSLSVPLLGIDTVVHLSTQLNQFVVDVACALTGDSSDAAEAESTEAADVEAVRTLFSAHASGHDALLALSILSRRAENRALLMQQHALSYALRILKLAALKFDTLHSLAASRLLLGAWCRTLLPLLAHCVQIVQNFTIEQPKMASATGELSESSGLPRGLGDERVLARSVRAHDPSRFWLPGEGERADVAPVPHRTALLIPLSHDELLKRVSRADQKLSALAKSEATKYDIVKLLKQQLLAVPKLVELMCTDADGAVSTTEAFDTSILHRFEQLLLRVLCVLCTENAAVQRAVHDTKVLDTCVGALGWRDAYTSDAFDTLTRSFVRQSSESSLSTSTSDVSSVGMAKYALFEWQLTHLTLITACVHDDEKNAQRFISLGGPLKLIDMVLIATSLDAEYNETKRVENKEEENEKEREKSEKESEEREKGAAALLIDLDTYHSGVPIENHARTPAPLSPPELPSKRSQSALSALFIELYRLFSALSAEKSADLVILPLLDVFNTHVAQSESNKRVRRLICEEGNTNVQIELLRLVLRTVLCTSHTNANANSNTNVSSNVNPSAIWERWELAGLLDTLFGDFFMMTSSRALRHYLLSFLTFVSTNHLSSSALKHVVRVTYTSLSDTLLASDGVADSEKSANAKRDSANLSLDVLDNASLLLTVAQRAYHVTCEVLQSLGAPKQLLVLVRDTFVGRPKKSKALTSPRAAATAGGNSASNVPKPRVDISALAVDAVLALLGYLLNDRRILSEALDDAEHMNALFDLLIVAKLPPFAPRTDADTTSPHLSQSVSSTLSATLSYSLRVLVASLRSFARSQLILIMVQGKGADGDEENEQSLSLVARYLEILSSFSAHSPSMVVYLLRGLLHGLRLGIRRSTLIQAGVFIKLTTLLHTSELVGGTKESALLCCEVFDTLNHLLAGSTEAKEHFSYNIGYDTFANLVRIAVLPVAKDDDSSVVKGVEVNEKSADDRLSSVVVAKGDDGGDKYYLPRSILQLVFNMIVEARFDPDASQRHTIENADALDLLLRLAPFFAPHTEQALLYDHFLLLLCSSTSNQSICCKHHVVYRLLELLPTLHADESLARKCLNLIEILGAHSITVRELKRLFYQLRSLPGDFRPPHWLPLVRSLRSMVSRRPFTGAEVFLDFDGRRSRMKLIDSCKKWPETRGFTVCAWLRVESFGSLKDDTRREPSRRAPRRGSAAPVHEIPGVIEREQQERVKASDAPKSNESNVASTASANSGVSGATRSSGRRGGSGIGAAVAGGQKHQRLFSFTHKRTDSSASGSSASHHASRSLSPNLLRRSQKSAHGAATSSQSDEEGLEGLECFFETLEGGVARLCMSWIVGGQRRTQQFDKYLFNVDRWYLISVTHSNQERVPWAKSEIRLYVDGKQVDKMQCKYHQFARLDHCVLGAAYTHRRASRRFSPYSHHFFGQLASFYMFNDVLNSAECAQIYALGPNYAGTFKDAGAYSQVPSDGGRSVVSVSQSGASGGTVAVEGDSLALGAASHLHLAFHSRAINNGRALDQSVHQRHADVTALSSCVCRDPRDIIQALGGLSVIFPLIAQLDQPLPPAEGGTAIDYEIDGAYAVEALALLADMLQESVTNQQQMSRLGGFAILGFLLQQISPRHLTEKTVNVLHQLLLGIADNEALHEDALLHVFLDFRIWVYAREPVQRQLLAVIAEHVHATPSIRQKFGVRALLDTIRLLYWADADSGVVWAKRPRRHPITRLVEAERPTEEETAALRSALLDLAVMLVKDGISMVEVRAIVDFFYECDDNVLRRDVFAFVRRLMMRQTSALTQSLRQLGGMQILLPLVRSDDELVRVGALRLIQLLFVSTARDIRGSTRHRALPIGKKARVSVRRMHALRKRRAKLVVGLAPPNTSSRTSQNGSLLLSDLGNDADITDDYELLWEVSAILRRTILCYEFTEPTFNVLFSLLLGKQSVDERRVPLNDAYPIEWPHLFPLIMECVAAGASEELRASIVQDLTLLVKRSADNCQRLLEYSQWARSAWQLWCLDMLDACVQSDDTLSFELTLTLMRTLLMHCLKYRRDGWREVEETLVLTRIVAPLYTSSMAVVREKLLSLIISELKQETTQHGKKEDVGQGLGLGDALGAEEPHRPSLLGDGTSLNESDRVRASIPAHSTLALCCDSKSPCFSNIVQFFTLCDEFDTIDYERLVMCEARDGSMTWSEEERGNVGGDEDDLGDVMREKRRPEISSVDERLRALRGAIGLENDLGNAEASAFPHCDPDRALGAFGDSEPLNPPNYAILWPIGLDLGLESGESPNCLSDATRHSLLQTLANLSATDNTSKTPSNTSVNASLQLHLSVLKLLAAAQQSAAGTEGAAQAAEVACACLRETLGKTLTTPQEGVERGLDVLLVFVWLNLVYAVGVSGEDGCRSLFSTLLNTLTVRLASLSNSSSHSLPSSLTHSLTRAAETPLTRGGDVSSTDSLTHSLARLLSHSSEWSDAVTEAITWLRSSEVIDEQYKRPTGLFISEKTLVRLRDTHERVIDGLRTQILEDRADETERLRALSTRDTNDTQVTTPPSSPLPGAHSSSSSLASRRSKLTSPTLFKRMRSRGNLAKSAEKAERRGSGDDAGGADLDDDWCLVENDESIRYEQKGTWWNRYAPMALDAQLKSMRMSERESGGVSTGGDETSVMAPQLATMYRSATRLARRLWLRILRDLTNERGAWATSTALPSSDERLNASANERRQDGRRGDDVMALAADSSRTRWRLDKTETFSRMRLKLKRNYKYTAYTGCAQDAEIVEEEDDLNALVKSVESGVKLTAIGGVELDEKTGTLKVRDDDEEGTASPEANATAPSGGGGATGVPADGGVSSALVAVLGEDELFSAQMWQEKEKDARTIHTCACQLVTAKRVIRGTLSLYAEHLHFLETIDKSEDDEPAQWAEDLERKGKKETSREPKDKRWFVSHLREIHQRRYLLRHCALELFMNDHTNYFFAFDTKKARHKLFKALIGLRPRSLAYAESRAPLDAFKRSALTKQWQQRQLSNFEYLMQLNTLAGRTYNDLTQYPVFPWVIADYTSEQLDFNDPKTFRDLSKPIGALEEKRREYFVERYEGFFSDEIPKFHYGSHYSSAGTVIHYLLRVEPFTRLAVELQGGVFDKPDRLFDSVPQTWQNCLQSTSDVKELIPEWYYLPEMFENTNDFYFGKKQNGKVVDDVVLPPWAKGSADEFVRLNREALESDYVSAHLHEWIDLIFGYKQRGPAAVEATNVFYFLTYEGAIDLDSIQDEAERRAIETQIENFGQTPSQLTRKPHPPRFDASTMQGATSSNDSGASLMSGAGGSSDSGGAGGPLVLFDDCKKIEAFSVQLSDEGVRYIGVPQSQVPVYLRMPGQADRVVTVSSRSVIGMHRWLPMRPTDVDASSGPPFTFEPDPLLAARKSIGLLDEHMVLPSSFAVSNDGRILFSCGHWDNAVRVTRVENGRLVQTVRGHKDVVTCISLGQDGRTLVSGSADTTVLVWRVLDERGEGDENNDEVGTRLYERPVHVLYGHDDEVTCVQVDTELDLCVSGSRDGTCILHTIREGRYVRTIAHPSRSAITLLCLAQEGRFVTYSRDDLMLRLYTCNGKALASANTHERLSHIRVTRDNKHLVTGGALGKVVVRRLYDLAFVHKFAVGERISSVSFAFEGRHFFVGTDDGKLIVMTRGRK